MKSRAKWTWLWVVSFLCLAPQVTVFAHEGQPPEPHDLWSAWNWDPAIVLGLLLSGWVYSRGLKDMQRRGSLSKKLFQSRGRLFLLGWFALFLALVSPVDALANALFSAHMLQHMLLILVAPPLLISSLPLSPFLLGLSVDFRTQIGRGWNKAAFSKAVWIKPVWRTLTHPLVAWSLYAFAFWVWHIPSLYQFALENEAIHILEHLSFLGTALLFWWTILHPQNKKSEGGSILALFTMVLQGGLLGALITFASAPWYLAYATTTQPWGITPLEDQQLAGAIMWLPGGLVYTLAAIKLFLRHITLAEQAARQRERWGSLPERETDSAL